MWKISYLLVLPFQQECGSSVPECQRGRSSSATVITLKFNPDTSGAVLHGLDQPSVKRDKCCIVITEEYLSMFEAAFHSHHCAWHKMKYVCSSDLYM
jgi:hypothetical protein